MIKPTHLHVQFVPSVFNLTLDNEVLEIKLYNKLYNFEAGEIFSQFDLAIYIWWPSWSCGQDHF